MSKTKTTTEQKTSTKKYISFTMGSSYSIDLENKLITPTDFSSIIDLDQFGSLLSIDGYQHTILNVSKVDYESDIFKKNIERAHSIEHFSDDIAIYRNIHNRAYCVRLAVEEDIILVELM